LIGVLRDLTYKRFKIVNAKGASRPNFDEQKIGESNSRDR